MPYETILYAVEDGIATITLNRPDRMNSLNAAMRAELIDALTRAPHESRVIVLAGAGRGFCAGQDLTDTGRIEDLNLQRVLTEEYEPLLKLVSDAPVPVIAAVNGAAAGAGANLALAADVVVAANSASFIEAFVRIGLIPDAGGTYWLPRLAGMARAMGMCLFAEPVAARQAAEWGLIWEAVEDDRLAERVGELASQLARGPTVAYRLMKQALRRSMANSLDAQFALEARLQAEAGQTRDFLEGIAAFLEKRPARYEGR